MRILLRLLVAGLLLASLPLAADSAAPGSYRYQDGVLSLDTVTGLLRIRPRTAAAIEVEWIPRGEHAGASFALLPHQTAVPARLTEDAEQLLLDTGALQLRIDPRKPQITFLRDGETVLAEELGFFRQDLFRGVRFSLQADEQLIGGGERVLGMDRRGWRLPLYNKPAYGYGADPEQPVEQMYFGLPAVLSSRNYLLLWDNPARGEMDLGASDPGVLQFQSVTGRMAYLLVAGSDFPDTLYHYTAVTGRQPMPPRWVFGSYASRFGYRSREQVEEVIERYRDYRIPLDALVFDIFWFGPDIKGHMGNLAWDRRRFPDPEGLLATLGNQGVHPVMVTEPFILTTSSSWASAVDAGALARDPGGRAKRFDFYFGNTGLVDVFDQRGEEWFWAQYRRLIDQGMEGIWGDLGEPEVHPSDTLHAGGSADALHNAYGHRWAELVYDNHHRDYPDRRPVILMRSGFAGSQRYGMLPWTGDVARDWSGLRPQVELSLQMGLLGLGYIHSDLGGFADGEVFDAELYRRWLQFGVFQPLFRPHAQEHIPPEPVFHGDAIAAEVRDMLQLRYALLPYLYTMAWENASRGMPLARPLFFLEPGNRDLFTDDRAFLWGPDLLVAPIVNPGVREKHFYLPKGVWFDFWTGEPWEGGREIAVPVESSRIPVFVRAGALLPMVPPPESLDRYSSEVLSIHYYPHASVPLSRGQVYEDDGHTPGARLTPKHELLQVTAESGGQGTLRIGLHRSGGDYDGRPATRRLTLAIHGQSTAPDAITDRQGRALQACTVDRVSDCFDYSQQRRRLDLRLNWEGDLRHVVVR